MPTAATLPDFASRLEHQGLQRLDDRPFTLLAEERPLLSPDAGDGAAKSLSLAPGATFARGAAPAAAAAAAALMARYGDWSEALLAELAPRYGAHLRRGRTSLRTRAVAGGAISARKDDRRLHVDAFASQPTGGRRILRVFSNINPGGEPRLWRIGEPFEAHARRWLDRLRPPLPGEAWALHRLRVTRARRTAYDALMLGLHDAAKLDEAYQRDAPRRDLAFPAATNWIVYTDSTVHAAIAGQYALEQTFYLPVEAMSAPETSPLRILERLKGRRLV